MIFDLFDIIRCCKKELYKLNKDEKNILVLWEFLKYYYYYFEKYILI